MYIAFLWVIAIICLLLPAWLLWNAWDKSRKLDSRLFFCDDSLLSDSSVKITPVYLAPLGTQVTENARFMVVPADKQIYSQNKLLE